MNKLCQQYLSNVKALLPIVGKPEKKYLSKLSESLEDFCEEERVTTLEEIYNGFGKPDEIIQTYFSSMDTSYLIRRIRFATWIKRGIAAFILISLIGVSIYGIKMYKTYKMLKQESIFFEDIIIEDVEIQYLPGGKI